MKSDKSSSYVTNNVIKLRHGNCNKRARVALIRSPETMLRETWTKVGERGGGGGGGHLPTNERKETMKKRSDGRIPRSQGVGASQGPTNDKIKNIMVPRLRGHGQTNKQNETTQKL